LIEILFLSDREALTSGSLASMKTDAIQEVYFTQDGSDPEHFLKS
jgi:hypothetical protein